MTHPLWPDNGVNPVVGSALLLVRDSERRQHFSRWLGVSFLVPAETHRAVARERHRRNPSGELGKGHCKAQRTELDGRKFRPRFSARLPHRFFLDVSIAVARLRPGVRAAHRGRCRRPRDRAVECKVLQDFLYAHPLDPNAAARWLCARSNERV